MTKTLMTTSEASDTIGVPHSTLKGWLQNIPVPLAVGSDGEQAIAPDGLALLQRIKTLWLEQGQPFETIRQTLRQELNEAADAPAPVIVAQGELARTDDPIAPAAIGYFTELAREFARAAHHIGRLEAENGFLRTQLSEARQLLTDGSPELRDQLTHTRAQHREARQLLVDQSRDHEALCRQLVQARRERDDLRAAFNRPWWQRLLLPAR